MKRPPRRWLLWGALLLLVVVLLGVLVFLAAEYEESRDQEALERDAASLAGDIRSGLVRNVQTLQALHSVAPTADSWQDPAAELLEQHRELVRLEWRDAGLRLVAARDSSYVSGLYGQMARAQALPDVRQACESAQRVSGPSFSPSYFWPMSNGMGMELMEMCLPVVRTGAAEGYLVATYALPGLLSELTNKALLRNRGLAFTEVDGTRLALHSTVPGNRSVQVANALLDLPGHTLMLRLESQRRVVGLFPNVLTAVVGALSLALLAVLVLLGRDMRRRQRAETEVAQALAFRKAMENSLVTGLRARDMNGRVTYVNPAFCQMVGFSASELIGSGLPAPWWPPELVDEYQQRQAVRLAGQVFPREGYESVFQRKDGTRFPVLIIEAPLIDAQGTQTGFMSAILDLSEQRRVEELNRASQERLQATARLATVGEMASLLSHELNQPLAAIASYNTGCLNLLNSENLSCAELKPALEKIGVQAQRAGKIIRRVHDFVRKSEPKRAPCALGEVIDDCLGFVEPEARKRQIRIKADIPDLPLLPADRLMLEQVLLNLMRNAMDAMSETPTAYRLLRLNVQIDSNEVRVSVADNGCGIAPEIEDKLYTAFFTTKQEGMGVGLSICRSIIEFHRGRLWAEKNAASPTGNGTIFIFTLPLESA